jgi:tRNA (cmo5U34)-methyltransferase
VLLAEQLPTNGHVLVLGAGGGLELNAMAELQPDWQFDGVDPSADMLAQARELTAPFADRITLHEGYIENAPVGPYDGAVCLLTLHFLPQAERLRTLREIAQRLRPAAPLVTAHHSFPLADGAQDRWLGRYAAYSGTQSPLTAMKDRLPVLPPETDEALLRQAGFTDIELFWAALTFKGWVSWRR